MMYFYPICYTHKVKTSVRPLSRFSEIKRDLTACLGQFNNYYTGRDSGMCRNGRIDIPSALTRLEHAVASVSDTIGLCPRKSILGADDELLRHASGYNRAKISGEIMGERALAFRDIRYAHRTQGLVGQGESSKGKNGKKAKDGFGNHGCMCVKIELGC